MKNLNKAWAVRILAGSALGLLASIVLVPYWLDTRNISSIVCLLCAGLGGAAGAATLPFADDGRALLLRSGAHFAVTSALFLLLAAQFYGWDWTVLLLLEGLLALLYALIWLGRWIGWYVEVVQLRTLLGLDAGPSPLKWRETLPYVPFALLLCLILPLLLYWVDDMLNRGSFVYIPALSGILYPYVFLPVGGRGCARCIRWPALCAICPCRPWCLPLNCSTASWWPPPLWGATCWAGCTAGRCRRRQHRQQAPPVGGACSH